MPSNLQVITAALRDINVLAQSEPCQPEQAVEALNTLNDMMAAWAGDGVELQYYPQSNVTDDLPVADKNVLAVRYNLAVLLATSYEREAPPTVVWNANQQMGRLVRESVLENAVERQSNLQPSGMVNGFYYDTDNL